MAGVPCTFKLVNAGGSLGGVVGWTSATAESHPSTADTNGQDIGYTARASYDRRNWFAVPTTSFDEQSGCLTIRLTPATSTVYIAYHEPYSLERHADLIARSIAPRNAVRCTHKVLGQTLDGRDMDLLSLGSGQRKVWLIGRQHPGETMASWFFEGFLERLLDASDSASQKLLRDATLYLVPNMNPDGSYRGHLRTNAVGSNLNREWATPTAERSPEVLCVRDEIDRCGIDFMMDVHG